MRTWIAMGSLAASILAGGVSAAATGLSAAELRQRGYDHFYNLEYSAAIADFDAITAMTPADPASWNRVAQARLYQEMFRVGALESELYGHGDPFLEEKLLPVDAAASAAFFADNQKAMECAQAALRAQPRDARLHYELGVAWAMRGTFEFTLRHAFMAALGDAKKARSEAEQAVTLDPSFIEPQLILGAHNYIAGSLPLGAKIFSSLAGYRGDKERGREEIAHVAATATGSTQSDAEVLLVIIDRRDGLNRAAVPLLAHLAQLYPRNALFAIEKAECLEASGEHDAARAGYERVITLAHANAPGYGQTPLDKVWYDLGNIERLYAHDRPAVEDYASAEAAPRAQPRYVQAAALAAGEVERRDGNRAAAQLQFQRCLAINPNSLAGKAAQQAIRP